jgi:uncharacterized protein (DUF3820 family)
MRQIHRVCPISNIILGSTVLTKQDRLKGWYLRYYLDLNVDATPHDAVGDILVLEELFKRIYAKFKENGVDDIESEMIRVTNSPVLVRKMPFGKHKGTLFTEIPADYLEWLMRTGDLDEDLEFTVKYHLGLIAKDDPG